MSAALSTEGTVQAVSQVPLGSELISDHAAGAMTLQVEDVTDFDETGGQLVVGWQDDAGTQEVIAYTAIDHDADTISLAVGLSAAWLAGTRIYLWDIPGQAPMVEYRALVAAPGTIDNNDSIEAVVSHPMIPLLAEGIRDPDTGESVRLEQQGTEWVVTDLRGLSPQVAGNMIRQGTIPEEALDFTIESGGVKVTIGNVAPTSPNVGDLWYDGTSGYQMNQWDGAAWQPYQWNSGAISDGAVSTPKIQAGAVTTSLLAAGAVVASKIATGALDAQTITAGILSAGVLSAGTIGSAHMINSDITASDYIIDTSGGRILIYQAATQTVTTLTATGAGTWTCPAGVTLAKIETWAGGGGGAGAFYAVGGSGGGGGEYACDPSHAVVPGNVYSYFIGAGGPTVAYNLDGNDGQDTYFDSGGAQLYCYGGSGGISWGNGGAGGAGGAGRPIHFSGGTGGVGKDTGGGGGGGGSSAGSTQSGHNGATATGTAGAAGGVNVLDGGAGAAGGNATSAGVNGGNASAPGGGGGGGGGSTASPATHGANGGSGGRGQIRITYTSGAPVLIGSIASAAGIDDYGNAYPAGVNLPTKSGDIPWTALPFASGFVNYSSGWDTCQYCKKDGIVYLRGLFKNSAIASSGGTIAVMPAGCRGFTATDGATNGNVVGTLAHNGSTNGTARLQIDSAGNLKFSTPTATSIPAGSNFTLGGCYVAGN